MTRLPLQRTRLLQLQERSGRHLFGLWGGTWRRRSLAVLALLIGLFAGNNLTSLWLLWVGSRPLVVLLLVVGLELLVRLRSRLVRGPLPLGWVILDNLRLGLVYAVVLEAFKLGS
jgi:hypothetical protein